MVAWSGKKPPEKPQVTGPDYVDPEGYGADPPLDDKAYIRPTVQKMDVLPYRGMEYHGVNPNLTGPPADINADVFDQFGVIPEQQQAPERHEVPVPVRIVTQDDDWEQKLVRTTGIVLSGIPITIVSHMQTRTNLVVTNNGTQPILISSEQQPSQPNSVTVAIGGTFTTSGQNRLYGVSADTSNQLISVMEEYIISAQRKPAF